MPTHATAENFAFLLVISIFLLIVLERLDLPDQLQTKAIITIKKHFYLCFNICKT